MLFRPNYILSLTVWTNIGYYDIHSAMMPITWLCTLSKEEEDIFYKVIYATLINLTENGNAFFYCN